MSIRKILALVDGSEASRTSLRSAFLIAKSFAAHVLAVHVRVEPTQAVPFVGEGMSGALVQELIELTEREGASRAAAAREIFDRLQVAADIPKSSDPAAGGPSAEWAEGVGKEDDALVRLGRLADLIVVARPATGPDGLGDVTLSRALFETGHPVLVAGREQAETVGRRIVIAWNGGVQAARAITAALPFLERAEWVTVIGVGDERGHSHRLADVAEYLAWHGIAADTHAIASRGSVGEALADAVAASGADLVVMGGYSHSRLRELILGGVSRHMLQKASSPLLLAH
jgi:nucleotide-binding universal stress UspA family protein